MNIYQIIFLSLVLLIILVFLYDKYSGRKITLAILQWKPAIAALSAFIKAVAVVLPSSYFSVISIILDAASAATQEAEKLYLMNELPKDERNQYAQKLIAEVLSKAGIEVTEQVQEIIDGCIAVVCMLMPHGVTPEDK